LIVRHNILLTRCTCGGELVRLPFIGARVCLECDARLPLGRPAEPNISRSAASGRFIAQRGNCGATPKPASASPPAEARGVKADRRRAALAAASGEDVDRLASLESLLGGTLKLKRIPYGEGSNGPYWYLVRSVEGRKKWTYIGKALPERLVLDRSRIEAPPADELVRVEAE